MSSVERAQRWREHLKRRAASGMSREAYCAWYGLSRSTLYRWDRRLREQSIRLRVLIALEQTEWIAVRMPHDVDVIGPSAMWSAAGC